ncbi:hypothetical protein Tco_0398364 [Tanacetum coccineum]
MLSLANTQEGMPRWIEESTRNEAIYTYLTLKRSISCLNHGLPSWQSMFTLKVFVKRLSFSQGLRNSNHIQTLDLTGICGRFFYEDNLISRRCLKNYDDDEVDERASDEYLMNLDIEFLKDPFWYGYIKNHKKTVKNGQARTRERKSVQKPEAKP